MERGYIDKNGDPKTRLGVTYNPFHEDQSSMGVLGRSWFLRSGIGVAPSLRRLQAAPSRDRSRAEKLTVVAWKKRYKAQDPNIRQPMDTRAYPYGEHEIHGQSLSCRPLG